MMTIDKTIEAIDLSDCECHGCLKYGATAHGLTYQNDKAVLEFANFALAAELKELREFIGDMNSIGIEEWVGRWKQGAFWFYDSAGIPVEYGTDPFDAWRKMKAGEGE